MYASRVNRIASDCHSVVPEPHFRATNPRSHSLPFSAVDSAASSTTHEENVLDFLLMLSEEYATEGETQSTSEEDDKKTPLFKEPGVMSTPDPMDWFLSGLTQGRYTSHSSIFFVPPQKRSSTISPLLSPLTSLPNSCSFSTEGIGSTLASMIPELVSQNSMELEGSFATKDEGAVLAPTAEQGSENSSLIALQGREDGVQQLDTVMKDLLVTGGEEEVGAIVSDKENQASGFMGGTRSDHGIEEFGFLDHSEDSDVMSPYSRSAGLDGYLGVENLAFFSKLFYLLFPWKPYSGMHALGIGYLAWLTVFSETQTRPPRPIGRAAPQAFQAIHSPTVDSPSFYNVVYISVFPLTSMLH
eukprot:TRINITY_DN75_c0_g1_i1.p2 TRINITY_DN75_c0_g1~~TRINITY_DN75_c0_g1_i1.p2  ORF type:complete len:357 (+),score=33.48 TRINITY_DN75_c0_g1_i1:1562-2632(+)